MSYRCLRSSDLKIIDRYQNELGDLHSSDEVIDFSLQSLKEVIPSDFVGWNHMMADRLEFLDAKIIPSLARASLIPNNCSFCVSGAADLRTNCTIRSRR